MCFLSKKKNEFKLRVLMYHGFMAILMFFSLILVCVGPFCSNVIAFYQCFAGKSSKTEMHKIMQGRLPTKQSTIHRWSSSIGGQMIKKNLREL